MLAETLAGFHSFQAVGLRISASCWLLAGGLPQTLPCGPLHMVAHNMAVGLPQSEWASERMRV